MKRLLQELAVCYMLFSAAVVALIIIGIPLGFTTLTWKGFP